MMREASSSEVLNSALADSFFSKPLLNNRVHELFKFGKTDHQVASILNVCGVEA